MSLSWTLRSAPLSSPLLIFRQKLERENSHGLYSATLSCIVKIWILKKFWILKKKLRLVTIRLDLISASTVRLSVTGSLTVLITSMKVRKFVNLKNVIRVKKTSSHVRWKELAWATKKFAMESTTVTLDTWLITLLISTFRLRNLTKIAKCAPGKVEILNIFSATRNDQYLIVSETFLNLKKVIHVLRERKNAKMVTSVWQTENGMTAMLIVMNRRMMKRIPVAKA